MPLHRVRTKVALTATLLFLVVLALVAGIQVCQLRAVAQHVASEQQFQLATRVAAEISGRLASRSAILGKEAAMLSALDNRALHARFDNDNALRILFDTVTVASANGQVDYGFGAGAVGNTASGNIADRAYFKDAIAQHATVISAPYREGAQQHPHIAIATPIMDAKGKIAGVLIGSIDLLGENFLGDLADDRIGRNGYFYVVTTGAAPVFVMHKNTERILTALPDQGVNPSLDRALQGFEGTLAGTNSVGVKGLFSFKKVSGVNWLLATVLPGEEVYGAAAHAVKTALLLILVIAVLGVVGIWALSYWLLKSES